MIRTDKRELAKPSVLAAQAPASDSGSPDSGSIVTIFLPTLHGGGAERVMVTLVNELVRQSVRTELLLFNRDGVYFDELNADVQVHSLGIAGRFSRVLGFFGYCRYVVKRKPSAVVTSGHSAYLVGVLAKLLIPHKIIVVTHNTVSREGRLSRFIPKYLYRFADEVVAVSRGVAEDLGKYGGIETDRIRVIHNPVDLERINNAMAAPVAHPWLASDTNIPVLLGVGRLNAQKRFDVLLRAVARVNAKRPVRLIILGEGPLRNELEGLARELGIADCVRFPGFVDNPYAYMRAASLFVLSSDFEGFGVVLVEALACDCPIVSTDCPSGPSEILENGRWGALTPVGDSFAIARAIEETLDHPPPRGHQRSRADAFSVEHSAEEYLEVIRGLAKADPQQRAGADS